MLQKKLKIIIITIFTSILFISIAITSYALKIFYSPLEASKEGIVFNVAKGTSAKKLAFELKKENIISNPTMFYLFAKIFKLDKKLQAGEYLATSNMNIKSLIYNVSNGKVIQYPITIIEGWNIKQLLNAIKDESKLKKTSELNINSLSTILNLPYKHSEGLFLPDTYNYTSDMSDVDLLLNTHKKIMSYLDREWHTRDKTSEINDKYKAIILASIVEKETSFVDEMPLVAGVYISRLKKNMRLQADPTVIYAHGYDQGKILSRKDLKIKSPYNTYMNKGLPPTPIALPSKQAIKAVLNPIINENIYFVADGKGKHIFSKNLEEHNKAVKQYREFIKKSRKKYY